MILASGATLSVSPWLLHRIISGGQSGADQAGLAAAGARGYATGGYMPLGFYTEHGPRPDLASHYGLLETPQAGYVQRTRLNVQNSDGTVIFVYGTIDGGSVLTRGMCEAAGKPNLVLTWSNARALLTPPGGVREGWIGPFSLANWIREKQIKTLNIAGNRESKSPGIYDRVLVFLLDVLVQR